MTTFILIVTLHGTTMQATPVTYTSMAECETQAAAMRLTASSTTRYDCVPA